jgi:hypothetical protein
MVLVLITVAGAIVAGYLAGGRLGNLGHVQLRRGWLLVVAVAAQVLLAVLAGAGDVGAAGRLLLALSHLGVLGFLWSNRLLPGVPMSFVGFAMNAVVITANGAMPVSRGALLAISPAANVDFAVGKHRLLAHGDPFWFFADIIPLPLLRTVVSVGDVVLAAGVGILVVHLMRRPARHAEETSAAQPVEGGV